MTAKQEEPVYGRVLRLSDPEQAWIARWVAIVHPAIAEAALGALARYRRDHPDEARAFLGTPTGG